MKNTLFITFFLITAAAGVSADPKAPEEDVIARYLFLARHLLFGSAGRKLENTLDG